MADLYNLDAELEQGLMGTDDDVHLVNTAISTDEDNTTNTINDPMEQDDDAAFEDAPGYQSMSTVPIALREAAMERQKIRRGGEKHIDGDGDHDDDDDNGVNFNKHSKDHWDTSKTDAYMFDTIQQQQEKRNYQIELQNLPYTRLYHAWVQECQAPELLPYPYETIQRIREGLLRYEYYSCTNGDPEVGNDDNHRHRHRRHTNENLNALVDSLLRIDAERVKFLLSDLLKRRIQKITVHPQHYAKVLEQEQEQQQQPHENDEGEMNDNSHENTHPLMCQAEITLLHNYLKIMKQHLSTTVTDHFPQEVWRTLDIPNDSVHEPNIQNQYVFIRCIENVTIPDSTQMNPDDSTTTETDAMTTGDNFFRGGQLQQAGMCLIVRYERIRHLLLQGKVELV